MPKKPSGSVYSVPSVVEKSDSAPSLIGYPPPAETLAFLDGVLKHGGPRKPGPGKKNGRPLKEPLQKSVSLSITLSCKDAADRLKAKAKAAQQTPGAFIEHKLKLLPPPSRRKRQR